MLMDARQLMTPAQPCLNEAASVVLAARRMRALGVSSIPVSGSGDDFIGMLSQRDIVERCVADAKDPRSISVGSLVQCCEQTVSADHPADATVLSLVLRHPQGQVPVVDNGVLVGVITLAGIASLLIDDRDPDSATARLFWPA
jgi:CBS domain-containing protein